MKAADLREQVRNAVAGGRTGLRLAATWSTRQATPVAAAGQPIRLQNTARAWVSVYDQLEFQYQGGNPLDLVDGEQTLPGSGRGTPGDQPRRLPRQVVVERDEPATELMHDLVDQSRLADLTRRCFTGGSPILRRGDWTSQATILRGRNWLCD